MHAGESRRSPDQGFTVAEVLFALSILLITVVAVIGAIQFAAASTQQSTHRDAAINVGNQVIELARNMPYDQLGTISPEGVYGDPPGSILTSQTINDFSVQTECTYGRDVATGRATYKLLRVVVSWEKPFANQVKLETAVMGRSTLTNTGDVLVEVLDSDSFEPVDGVSVVIDPASGANRTRSTDASGQAFFGYVSIGALTFTADKTGYLIDMSPLSGASVAADALSNYTLHAQLPSTGIVNVTGSDGQPIAGATVTLTGDTAPTPTMTLTTGAGGSVTFDNLFKGSHTVNVNASGRVPGTGVLDVTAGGQTVTLNLSLADPNQLTVTVRRSSDSAPIAGATVSVQGPSPSTGDITGSPATSASSGLATFDLPGGGHYLITVSRLGYTSQSRSITVANSGTYSETFSMVAVAAGTLRVEVTRSSNGSPRSGVRVLVTGLDGIVYSSDTNTDSSGLVIRSGLVPGRYQVQVRRSSPSSWITRTPTVASGATSVVAVSW